MPSTVQSISYDTVGSMSKDKVGKKMVNVTLESALMSKVMKGKMKGKKKGKEKKEGKKHESSEKCED